MFNCTQNTFETELLRVQWSLVVIDTVSTGHIHTFG